MFSSYLFTSKMTRFKSTLNSTNSLFTRWSFDKNIDYDNFNSLNFISGSKNLSVIQK